MIDPEIERAVAESFAAQTFMRTIGARISTIAPGYVEIELPVRDDLLQQHGFVHAGVTSAIADTAGGYAAMTLFPLGLSVLTIEFKINLLAPARGEKLNAVGKVEKAGKTITFCDLRVFSVGGHERTLIATGQQTMIRAPATRG